ncbi:MAG TPA: tlde1 domain-containing protein [Terriglobales bacterium]|nr:tlde1 domain-containing protein [Terriglobales bacterium]
MSWTFEISTGKLYDASGKCVATGYAGGGLGKEPEAKDNPAAEPLKGIGPLPEGRYTLATPVPSSQLGQFAIPLVPDAANQMYGRSGFYCHGDSIENPGCASEGCVIMPRAIREAMWNSPDHDLQVVATYLTSGGTEPRAAGATQVA